MTPRASVLVPTFDNGGSILSGACLTPDRPGPFISPSDSFSSAPSTPLRVTHAVLSLDVGGLERVVLELVRAGRARGHTMSVVCLERPGALADRAVALGATVRSADKPAGIRPAVVGRLAGVFRELRPDVVHSHQLGALLYAGPAARRAGVPVVVHTEHGQHYAHSRKARWLGRFATRYARRVFGVSADIVNEVVRCGVAPAGKVASAVNGIDVGRFAAADGAAVRSELGVRPDEFLVGTVGRLAEIKRQDVLLRGFARLLEKVPGARLVLVGGGPEREALEGLARDLGIADRSTFAGVRDRPEEFLAAMDAFALTSRSEGTPLAVLEAWAAGKPVVASAVGGIPELVRDGETGILFPPGDSNALAERLVRLANDPAVRTRLGKAGRDRAAAQFDVGVMAAGYEGHYRSLLPRTGDAGPCASSP
jgi:sugar transferase (PEP-CTERM/EpsH1 system associated)